MWDLLHGRADVEHLLAGFPENMTDFTLDATTHGLWHIQHCFDYLRQSLQCSADTSLEWPVEVNGQNLVVGWENYVSNTLRLSLRLCFQRAIECPRGKES